MPVTCRTALVGMALLCGAVAPLAAQTPEGRGTSVEVSVGSSAFIDEAPIQHFLVGGSARFQVTPRLSIGPEIVYMIGPGHDRDLFLTGNVTFDFVRPRPTGRPRLVPYVVAGGGFFRHSDRFFNETFASNEGAFTLGGGLRIAIGERAFIAPEYRLGWEPHARVSVTFGALLP